MKKKMKKGYLRYLVASPIIRVSGISSEIGETAISYLKASLFFLFMLTCNLSYGKLLDSCILNIDDINQVRLKHVKQIKTKPNAIFYNLIPTNSGFLGFYRNHYGKQELGVCELNHEFDIVYDSLQQFPGEDPRTFQHQGAWYATDNFFGRNAIYQIHEIANTKMGQQTIGYYFSDCIDLELKYGTHSRMHQDGKNPTYLSDGKNLYFIKWFYPLEVYQFTQDLDEPRLVHRARAPANDEYRGGTAGFPTLHPSVFIGFGHSTTQHRDVIKHKPFIWELNISNFTLKTKMMDIDSPMNIIDPVTIVKVRDKFYLITAESQFSWIRDQDYITNVWEIL